MSLHDGKPDDIFWWTAEHDPTFGRFMDTFDLWNHRPAGTWRTTLTNEQKIAAARYFIFHEREWRKIERTHVVQAGVHDYIPVSVMDQSCRGCGGERSNPLHRRYVGEDSP